MKAKPIAGAGAVLLCLGVGIWGRTSQAAPAAEGPKWSASEVDLFKTLALDGSPPPSPSNRFAENEAAANLGQSFFFDTGFSADGSQGCVSCHKPALYFTDGQPLAVGLGKLTRHTPSIMGSQWNSFQFWDGRKDTLWSQALAPFEGELELGVSRMHVVRRVATEYADEYASVFDELPSFDVSERWPAQAMPVPKDPQHPWALAWEAMDPADRELVNRVFANVGKSIEAYERMLTPQSAPFDRYVAAVEAGDMSGAGHLSPTAERGLRQFIGPAGCIHCHNGPMFSDQSFHAIGLESVFHSTEIDLGRAAAIDELLADPFNSNGKYSDSEPVDELVYLNPEVGDTRGAFRTPTLRNVQATAPYGHNGQFRDLNEVIEWYRELPRVPLAGHRDKILKVLPDDVITADLIAFLESLTGQLPAARWLAAPEQN